LIDFSIYSGLFTLFHSVSPTFSTNLAQLSSDCQTLRSFFCHLLTNAVDLQVCLLSSTESIDRLVLLKGIDFNW